MGPICPPATPQIESGQNSFHYIHLEGVCFLCLAERSYPKRLAFRCPQGLGSLAVGYPIRDGSGDGGGRDGGSGGSYRHMSRAPTRDKSGSAVSPHTLAPHLAPHLAARSIHITVGVHHGRPFRTSLALAATWTTCKRSFWESSATRSPPPRARAQPTRRREDPDPDPDRDPIPDPFP